MAKQQKPEVRIDAAIRKVESKLSKLKIKDRWSVHVGNDLDGKPIWLRLSRFDNLEIVYEQPRVHNPCKAVNVVDELMKGFGSDDKQENRKPIVLQRAELPLKMVVASMLPAILAEASIAESRFESELNRTADMLDKELR